MSLPGFRRVQIIQFLVVCIYLCNERYCTKVAYMRLNNQVILEKILVE